MNNIERAIEIIEGEHDPYMGPIDAPSLVYAMNGAGLIAQDLPEPDKDSTFVALGPTWEVRKEHGGVYAVTSRNGLVYAPGDTHSPAQARAMALALLAAADHADRHAP